MSDRPPLGLRPAIRLAFTVGGFAVLAAVFLIGPSGLPSVWSRSRRSRRLEREIARVHETIQDRSAVRARLADPETAGLLARRIFGSDSLRDSAPDR